MNCAYFCFHNELSIFFPPRQRHVILEKHFSWRASIKDMIESMGVPHAEIDLLIVNGVSVDFSYIVQPDDRIDVYHCFDEVDLPNKIRLRPLLEPREIRFVLDAHLGRLAAYLRMMGFDTLYRNDFPDEELAEISHRENRVLLTRDVGLLKRSIVQYGYFVREVHAKPRIREILRRFNLSGAVVPFKHCIKCNGLLSLISRDVAEALVAEDTFRFYDEFHQCNSCQQVYWKGPHFERMKALIDEILVTTHDD